MNTALLKLRKVVEVHQRVGVVVMGQAMSLFSFFVTGICIGWMLMDIKSMLMHKASEEC